MLATALAIDGGTLLQRSPLRMERETVGAAQPTNVSCAALQWSPLRMEGETGTFRCAGAVSLCSILIVISLILSGPRVQHADQPGPPHLHKQIHSPEVGEI